MSETARSRAAALAHLRRDGLAKGDPIPLPLTMAAIFHPPGRSRRLQPVWPLQQSDLGCRRGRCLAIWKTRRCVAFPSGMAAISAVFFGLLKSGDRVLLPSDGYHATRALAERFLKPFGVAFDLRPTSTFLDGGFDGYRLVFVETPFEPATRHLRYRRRRRGRPRRRRDPRRRQHDDDALRPAPARSRRRHRRLPPTPRRPTAIPTCCSAMSPAATTTSSLP